MNQVRFIENVKMNPSQLSQFFKMIHTNMAKLSKQFTTANVQSICTAIWVSIQNNLEEYSKLFAGAQNVSFAQELYDALEVNIKKEQKAAVLPLLNLLFILTTEKLKNAGKASKGETYAVCFCYCNNCVAIFE